MNFFSNLPRDSFFSFTFLSLGILCKLLKRERYNHVLFTVAVEIKWLSIKCLKIVIYIQNPTVYTHSVVFGSTEILAVALLSSYAHRILHGYILSVCMLCAH